MRMIIVGSDNLEEAGYDEQLRLLHIQFSNGALYEYYDVPMDVYIGLITASSAGKYFHEYVKGHYRYSRVWVLHIKTIAAPSEPSTVNVIASSDSTNIDLTSFLCKSSKANSLDLYSSNFIISPPFTETFFTDVSFFTCFF